MQSIDCKGAVLNADRHRLRGSILLANLACVCGLAQGEGSFVCPEPGNGPAEAFSGLDFPSQAQLSYYQVTVGVGRPISASLQQKIDVMRNVPIFKALKEEDLRFMAERAVARNYSAGQLIFAEGDSCEGLYIVQAGLIKIFKSSPAGREQVLGMERPGSSVAELLVFDGGPYPASTSAVEDSTLLFIHKDDFYQLCRQQPEVALKVLRVVGARLRHLVGLIEELSFKTVRHRLAGLLVRLAERRGKRTSKGIVFTLTSSNQELASEIGTVRELVSRNLSELQAQNLVRVAGKTLTIPNLDALRRIAEPVQ